ncbi:MAG: hypothetical protein JNG89_13820 [Planctomycetaceae bacterium]|nr:hypothetical protein [Planctomycetaceae bacterium]
MIRRLPAIWAWCWCAAAMAQPAAPVAPEQAAAPAAEQPAEAAVSGNSLFIQNPDGRWVAAPREAVEAGSGNLPAAVPAYIAQLQIDGEVVGDHADLTALIRVEITRDGGWFELPLRFDQAAIYDSIYTGAGRHAPVVQPPGATDVRWRFSGAGTHRLELKFRLPVKSTAAGQQLQLSLPTLPANYIARAVLRIPDGHVVTSDPPQNVTLHKQVLETGVTELQCDIAGERWDLSWRTGTDAAPRLSQVVTGIRVRADRDARLLRMMARQQCTIEQGELSEISVRMPSGFEVESVDLLQGETRQSLSMVEEGDRQGWSRVFLGEGVQGVFELEWQFQRALPGGGDTVVVDGLEVTGARRQGGTIEIESVEGYAARYQASDSSALQRVDVADRRPGEAALDFGFEFLRQPFAMSYELAPVAAQTDAESEAFLMVNSESNDLYVDVHVKVLTGQVHEIVFDWPNHVSTGWIPAFSRALVAVDPGGTAVEVVDGTLDQDAFAADPDQLRLQLSRPCDGTLQTLLHFTRESEPHAGRLELSLPRPVATVRRAHALTLASAVNLQTTLTVDGNEPPRLPREGQLPAGLPSQFAAADVRVYSLAPDSPPVAVEWTEQRRSIVADATVSAEVLKSSIHVVQDISYNVSYDHVATLLLEPPPGFPGGTSTAAISAGGGLGLRVLLDGQELPAEIRDGYWRIELPDPRRGRFQLTVEYGISAQPDAESGTVAVPILKSVDAPFKTTTLRLLGSRTLRLADDETGWQSWLTRAAENAWLSSTQRTAVKLRIDDTARNIPQQFTIDSAFVRTWFGDPGQVAVYAEYAIKEAPPSIVVKLPAQSAAEFLWNGAALAPRRDSGDKDQAFEEYVVELPVGDQPAISGRLSIRYRSRRNSPLGLVSSSTVEFPEFGDNVLVNDSYWEVVLPPGQQLYASPAGMVPQYSWERETVLWARRPTTQYRELREQIVRHEQDADSALPRGNVYAYSSLGAVTHGEFGAMELTLIVLIGAGVSLLLGFMFRRLPATRNVLSVLVLGFCLALAALWELELIQLLLQPAVLGLALAAIAASFDVARRDQRRGARSEHLSPSSDRRSTAVPLPVVPARTAVYHPEPVSDTGRSG